MTLLPEGAEMAALGLDAFPFEREKEGLGSARTGTVAGGGVAPTFKHTWGDGDGGGGGAMLVRSGRLGVEDAARLAGGGALEFEALGAEELRRIAPAGVLLELWDESSIGGDQLIANAVLPVPASGAPVQLRWVEVKPKGEVRVAVFEA